MAGEQTWTRRVRVGVGKSGAFGDRGGLFYVYRRGMSGPKYRLRTYLPEVLSYEWKAGAAGRSGYRQRGVHQDGSAHARTYPEKTAVLN